jgi:hypothetical protein
MTRETCKHCAFRGDCKNGNMIIKCPCKICILNPICEICCEEAHNYFVYCTEMDKSNELKRINDLLS